MVPFFILVATTLALRGLGAIGVSPFASFRASLRVGLAIMFAFTGTTHFTGMKHEYALMIPDFLPFRLELVYLSGALELLGALGLLVPRWRRAAGIGLFVLLLAVLPANVHAYLADVPFRGDPPTSLWLRAPIQFIYLVALWATAVKPSAREAPTDAGPGTGSGPM